MIRSLAVRRLPAAGVAMVLTSALLTTPTAGARSTVEGYSNPVTAGFSADFPDPSMIKGRDGWW